MGKWLIIKVGLGRGPAVCNENMFPNYFLVLKILGYYEHRKVLNSNIRLLM